MWTLAESTLHDFDSVAISLSPDLQIRWYGLAYLAGFLVGWLGLRWMARTKRSLVPERSVGDLIVYTVVGIIVGGRLGYALFYQPSLFWTFSPSFPWWELFAINRGGMASHGGMIGLFIAMLLFSIRQRLPLLHVLDVVSLAATPGLFLGRIANLINGELWGKALADSMQADPPWWSLKYPEEVQTLDMDLSAVTPHVDPQGVLPLEEVRGLVETALRDGDPVVVEAIVPQLTAWWPSQFIQAIAEGPVLFVLMVAVWWSPRRPGLISGVFLLGYGAMRIATEVVRQPDAGVDLILGLQRGQLLSVGMIVAGIVLCVVSDRSTASRRVGGFGRGTTVESRKSKVDN